MKSRVLRSIKSCLGRDSCPANFGWSPESITKRKGPVSKSVQFEPIPPCGFKSVIFMNELDWVGSLWTLKPNATYEREFIVEFIHSMKGSKCPADRWT